MKKTSHSILLVIFISLLGSCASNDSLFTNSAEEDYFRAERLIENNEHGRALIFLSKYAAEYPYSKYATDAEFLRIQAAIKNGEYILSETLAQRFIKAHPEHPKRIDAEYLLAQSYLKQSSKEGLQQTFSHKARDAFFSINQRFPGNKYAEKVDLHIGTLTNRLATHEIIIGKFYFGKKRYVAAVNRFLVIKNDYQGAKVSDENLYWLIQAYNELGQNQYANEISQLLAQTYPESTWLKKL